MADEGRNILLIEDEEADVFLFRRGLSRCNFPGNLRVVENAWRARDYMEGRGAYSDREYYPIPELIVSDLHLPGASGEEFVKWLRETPRFKNIPLVLWSGSMPEEQVRRILENGANAYYRKTADFRVLCEVIHEVLAQHLPTQ
jgi:CheY-like chemotaxis protein